MAALWRAFLILGNPLCRIPDKEKGMLRVLQDLYQRQISNDILGFASAGGRMGGDGNMTICANMMRRLRTANILCTSLPLLLAIEIHHPAMQTAAPDIGTVEAVWRTLPSM